MQHLVHSTVRAFVALADTGTLTQAGEAINKSASAVSLQIAALEQRVGRQLFVRSSRGMQLSQAGERLLTHARALLAIESQAADDLRNVALSGDVRFGMPQDFASSRLAATLTRFRRAHPGVKVAAVIERNYSITAMVRRNEIDLALLISRRAAAKALTSSVRPSHWYAGRGFTWDRQQPLPLVALEEPCIYREDALAALQRAGMRWDVVFSTANVTAMWAAVAAGVGVTVRMDLGAPRDATSIDDRLALPKLPPTAISLVRCAGPGSDATGALAALVSEVLTSLSAPQKV